jgi:type IV pilus assembly protein PilA
VVAIIRIIAAIAIPDLMRDRMSANESSAVGSVRSINTAEISYNTVQTSAVPHPCRIWAGPPVPPGYLHTSSGGFIESSLSTGTTSGHNFTPALGSSPAGAGIVPSYSISALLVTPNQTGTRYFCSFEDAVVRSSTALSTLPCAATTRALQ